MQIRTKSPRIAVLSLFLPGLMLIAAACGSSQAVREVPMAVHIPTAGEVAKQVSCKDFRNTGQSEIGGVITSGTCMIGDTRYAIDTFGSMRARNHWLDLATQYFSLDVKWKTSTSVVYVATHQPAGSSQVT
jgi:hypothetical protein